MRKSTPALIALESAGVAFETLTYDYDPAADRIGVQAAQAIGEAPQRMLKTLMAEVDGEPACVVVPCDREISMKKLAAALGGKSARMMRPADAERLSGYKVGGISPLGQKRRVRTVIELATFDEPHVCVNGGMRGLQVRLKPDDLSRVLDALGASIVA